MIVKIEKANSTGFCFGVKRTIAVLEKAAAEHGQVETLGAVVHNQQVIQKLTDIGIRAASSIDDIQGNIVAIGAHGVSPAVETELRRRCAEVINTTCPFVHRAQVAARRLAKAGFFVVVYGESNHPEVKGILGWAEGKGVATLEADFAAGFKPLPRRLGILSQTTQIPAYFCRFVKEVIDVALVKDAELRIIDTICHDIRDRQQAALKLAKRVDLMLVIGSLTSANTKHLAELCATVTQTEFIENANGIQHSWLQGHRHIGVAAGASTDEATVDEVVAKLRSIGKTLP
ncbi:MAG: 4-hydroxy-3-methylbut-2-enyl diphosphate reductase [Chloroflexota bacterium]